MLKVKQGLFVIFIVTVIIFFGVNSSGAEDPKNNIKTIEITEVVINEDVNNFEEELFTVFNDDSEPIITKEDIRNEEEKNSTSKHIENSQKITNEAKEIVFTVGDVVVRYEDIETYYEDDFKPYKEEYPDLNQEETEQSIIDEEILEEEMFVSFEEEVEEFNLIPDIYYGKDFLSYEDEYLAYDNTEELVDVPLGTGKDIYETSLAVEFSYDAPELLEVPYREDEEEIIVPKEDNDKGSIEENNSSLPSEYDDTIYYY